MTNPLIKAIDEAVQKRHAATEPPRRHLGASGAGAKCPRQVWYAFRWAHLVKHTGRLLRLFERGHREEERFIEFLRLAGAEVRPHAQRLMYHSASDSYVCTDWDNEDEYVWAECDDVSDSRFHHERANSKKQGPRQWGFKQHKGHYAGSGDGKILGTSIQHLFPQLQLEGWGAVEFKTSNDKSFKVLKDKGVLSSKPVHYVQMQQYMYQQGVGWCLYMAVNKNDDDLYVEIVFAKPELGSQYSDRALAIIECRTPPPKYSQDPSWFECKFCDFREICHYDKPMDINCRSCAYSEPVQDGAWKCRKWEQLIPKDFELKGCEAWEQVK